MKRKMRRASDPETSTGEQSARPLRIMMVDSGTSWGGGQIYALRLSMRLIARGHQVTFVCRRKDWLQSRLRENGVPSWPAAPRNSGDLLSALRMALALWWGRYDAIHGHFSRDYVPVVLAGWLARRPAILTRHVLFAMSPHTVRAASHASRVIAVSEAVRRVLVGQLGLSSERVVTVHSGINVRQFQPRQGPRTVLTGLGIPADAPVVGTLCRIDEGKGIDTFLKAAALAHRNFPDARFVLIGDGPGRPGFERLAQDLGIASQTLFTGYRSDPWALLPELDAFVLATANEPFGLVIIEAMASGVPVIAGDSGGPLEIVAHGQTGILYPADDETALAAAIEQLLSDLPHARVIGTAARLRAEQHFNEERMVDAMEAIYRQA